MAIRGLYSVCEYQAAARLSAKHGGQGGDPDGADVARNPDRRPTQQHVRGHRMRVRTPHAPAVRRQKDTPGVPAIPENHNAATQLAAQVVRRRVEDLSVIVSGLGQHAVRRQVEQVVGHEVAAPQTGARVVALGRPHGADADIIRLVGRRLIRKAALGSVLVAQREQLSGRVEA
jgi:hypothetical protein